MVIFVVDLTRLDDLTNELAQEIHTNKGGHILDLLKFIFDKIDTQIMIIDEDDRILFNNLATIEHFKKHSLNYNTGIKWYEAWNIDKCPETGEPLSNVPHKIAMEKRKVITREFTSPFTGFKCRIIAIPLLYNGISGTICVITPLEDDR